MQLWPPKRADMLTAAELLDTADIARMLGLSREYVTDKLTKRQDFPRPALDMSRRLRRWKREDVQRWAGLQPGGDVRG